MSVDSDSLGLILASALSSLCKLENLNSQGYNSLFYKMEKKYISCVKTLM